MTVSDNVIKGESFFKILGKTSAQAGKILAINLLKNPSGALEIGANVATAAASGSPKAASATLPVVIKIYHEGHFVLYKWNKKQIDYTQPHHFEIKILI